MLASMLLEEAGPNTELNWLLLVFLAFFFLMVVVGWWVSRRNGGQAEILHEAPVHHEEHIVSAEPVSNTEAAVMSIPHEVPVIMETPTATETVSVPDDLVRLEGIGPKVARVLNDAGITTFAGLAGANAADIQKILSAAGLQMMNPEGWIEQAVLAAKGDWAALEKLQGELKGGRRK